MNLLTNYNSKLPSVLIVIGMIAFGCTKVYDPQVNGTQKIIVVDGLITNAAEKYFVNLSYAISFNSNITVPVTKALVTISDDQGNSFKMQEDSGDSGRYFTVPTQFMGVIGRTYTLHITASDGTTYQSGTQLLLQPLPIDSIYGFVYYQPFVQTGGVVNVEGINSYININRPSGSAANLRFVDSLLIECYYQLPGQPRGSNPLYYGWYVDGLDQELNIAGSNNYTNTSNIIDHALTYFPLELSIYNFNTPPPTYKANIWKYIMYVNVYAINNETYTYFNKIDEQINAGNQLFDPIAQQVQGNITCTSDPGKIVFGKFEASAYIRQTYVVALYYSGSNVTVIYTPISNLQITPFSGTPTMLKPTFWVN